MPCSRHDSSPSSWDYSRLRLRLPLLLLHDPAGPETADRRDRVPEVDHGDMLDNPLCHHLWHQEGRLESDGEGSGIDAYASGIVRAES